MCHDLSFSANTVEFITDLLPDIEFDHQLDIDFSMTDHTLSMSHKKHLVLLSKENHIHLNTFEWGLIADFMNTPEALKKYRNDMANARAEKIFDKRSVWCRIRKQRCLVAVNGIYEHRKVAGFKNKIPYYIKLKSEQALLLPGFYNYSPNADPETGEMTGTFSIITRSANEIMSQIHNDGNNKHRMPLFVPAAKALQWLDESMTDESMQAFIDYCIDSTELTVYPVWMIRTTKERPDGKEKSEPFEYEYLPALGDDGPAQEKQSSLF